MGNTIFQIRSWVVTTTLAIVGFAGGCEFWAKAQTPSSCSVESKSQSYREFVSAYEGDLKDMDKALQSARRYLACPADADEQSEILAKLNVGIGRILSSRALPAEAIPYFIRAASYNSSVKNSARTYADLANAYEEGPYEKLAEDYRNRFGGKRDTKEGRLALEPINALVDLRIDALARTVSLAGMKVPRRAPGSDLRARSEQDPAVWMDELIGLYTYRHRGSLAGLEDLIANIFSKPLPVNAVSALSRK
jgi:tetratricopeptide (TPR) repeat protein